MLQTRTILKVNDSIVQICGFLSQTGCECGCSSCQCSQSVGTCVDCVDCPNLTIADIDIQIGRKGQYDASGEPIYLFSYPAFTLAGNQVCFMVDSTLTSLFGRYIGQIMVQNNPIQNYIEMQVGAPYSVCQPYTLNASGMMDDMDPSGE